MMGAFFGAIFIALVICFAHENIINAIDKNTAAVAAAACSAAQGEKP